jgi:acetoin utilization protein AcuB
MIVSENMNREAVTALPTTPLSAVRDVMTEHGFGVLLVAAEDGTLGGFITRATLKGITSWDDPVEKVVHPARFAVAPDDTLEKAALILLDNRLSLLPVVEDGRLVGVLTQSEVLRGLVRALGIGQEGTRLQVRVRRRSTDLYEVLAALREHGADVLSVCRDQIDGAHDYAVVRVQGLADREALRTALEALLRKLP